MRYKRSSKKWAIPRFSMAHGKQQIPQQRVNSVAWHKNPHAGNTAGPVDYVQIYIVVQ